MGKYHGIIFAYKDAPELGDLTRERTVASLPFCGRYRLIDFALSSMKNAGITDVGVVMGAVIIMSVWAGFGNYMLYFVTGMTSISEDVYESSRIDGANAVQTFFKITLPMLAPVLKVVLMLAITGAFKDYEAIMVLTNGGPGNRTNVMFLYIYNLIFSAEAGSQAQIGYGALLSVVAAVIVGAVTIIYNLVARKLVDVM